MTDRFKRQSYWTERRKIKAKVARHISDIVDESLFNVTQSSLQSTVWASTHQDQEEIIEQDDYLQSQPDSTPDTVDDSSVPISSSSACSESDSPGLSSLQLEKTEFGKKVLLGLEEVKSLAEHNNRLLLQLLQLMQADPDGDIQHLPENVNLPLSTVQDLDDLEESLAIDDDLKKTLFSELVTIGGNNQQTTVTRMMERVIGPELANRLNWFGKGKKNKIAFGEKAICKLIYKSVKKNPYCSQITEADYQRIGSNWLRNACDRNGGRKRREERKCAAAAARAQDDRE